MSQSPTPIPAKPMRDALLQRIYETMATDKDIFFVTADFGSPVLDKIRTDYSDRFVNVGIAEQNLINVTAGLALEGYKVFAYAIAPFITMRCYEQIRVSLALLSQVRPMNVTLIGVGAGYSYVVSGPTHQCYEDLTLMRALPVMQVHSPADHVTTTALLESCLAYQGPSYLRLDAQMLPVLYPQAPEVARGFHMHQTGQEVCLLATGYMMHTALDAAQKLQEAGQQVGVIDLFSFNNDEKALVQALASYRGVVTMEEGFRGAGGLDAWFHAFTARHDLTYATAAIGVTPGYSFELGSRTALHAQVGLGVDDVCNAVAKISTTLRHSSAA